MGAGKVEDTYNVLGHALRKAVSVLAHQQGRGLAEMAPDVVGAVGASLLGAVGASLLGGAVSLKAALDLHGDDPHARTQGLVAVLGALDALEQWLAHNPTIGDAAADVSVQASRAAAVQVRTQDVESLTPLPSLRQGVSRERRISIEDREMRHGRKSRSVRVDGYSKATNAMCCTTWTAGWSVPSGSRRPTQRKPV